MARRARGAESRATDANLLKDGSSRRPSIATLARRAPVFPALDEVGSVGPQTLVAPADVSEKQAQSVGCEESSVQDFAASLSPVHRRMPTELPPLPPLSNARASEVPVPVPNVGVVATESAGSGS